jgi:hypothetical protein
MRYTDPNIAKILSLLAYSKDALDKVYEKAQEYAESDKDVTLAQDMLESDLEFQKDEPEMDHDADIARSRARLEREQAANILLAAELATLCKSLEDNLGSAGRVSDHFNKKVYPLGMSPL